MESSKNHDAKQEIESLMTQVRQLEEENQNLYSSILKMGFKKNKQSLEYYVRLRKDLMSEQSKLAEKLSLLESEKAMENSNIQEKMAFLEKKIEELNAENKSLKEKLVENKKEQEKKTEIISKRKVELKNEVDQKKIEELESEVNNLMNTLNQKELVVQSQKEKIDEIQ